MANSQDQARPDEQKHKLSTQTNFSTASMSNYKAILMSYRSTTSFVGKMLWEKIIQILWFLWLLYETNGYLGFCALVILRIDIISIEDDNRLRLLIGDDMKILKLLGVEFHLSRHLAPNKQRRTRMGATYLDRKEE
jgi:hypothetical protein